MNPSSNEASGMQLPAPIMEQVPHQNMPVQAGSVAPEQGAFAAPELPQVGQAPAAAAPTMSPLPVVQTAQPVAQNDVSATTQSSTPMVADDGDLIEKEWVNKAKAIVERNRDDPYKQTEELTGVKADYMQQRYNKTIKLNK